MKNIQYPRIIVSSLGNINSLIINKHVSGSGLGKQDWAEVPKAAKYIISIICGWNEMVNNSWAVKVTWH